MEKSAMDRIKDRLEAFGDEDNDLTLIMRGLVDIKESLIGRPVVHLLIVGAMVFGMAEPSTAGPVLESAMRAASGVSLEQVEPAEASYRKGSARKWLEWVGLVGGALMTATVEERCLFNACDRRWSRSVGGVGLALVTVSAISKALPDPDQ